MGGPERGGFIYPRVDEGGTARSLYSRKDVALGSVKPQMPGFSVEGGGCGGAQKGGGGSSIYPRADERGTARSL